MKAETNCLTTLSHCHVAPATLRTFLFQQHFPNTVCNILCLIVATLFVLQYNTGHFEYFTSD